jgi:ubiquinone/menaquinone biosynthesis C-methylase UbiE
MKNKLTEAVGVRFDEETYKLIIKVSQAQGMDLINIILGKVPTQLRKMKDNGIIIKGSVNAPVRIAVGNGNVWEIDLSARSPEEQEPETRKSSKDEQQAENGVPYSSELESEISDLFKSVYQKEREKGESDVNSKTLTFLKNKLHDLAAAKSPFKWLDVGCGYGRALDALDAIKEPQNIIQYHGIDFEPEHIDEAKKRTLNNPKIEKMDASKMNFDSEFDIISAVLLLHEVDPLCLPYIIRNMIRALKPEGTLVISDFQGPYEQEEGIVAWSAEDIEFLLENICEEAKVSFEPLPAGKYPKELGFYACYVKKSTIDDTKFETFMKNYNEFLKQKKTESKELRNELRQQLKERITKILERSDIDTKNISDEEMEKIKNEIEDEYGIKAHKIRLLTNQIEFLDDKIEEFDSGTRCAGAN